MSIYTSVYSPIYGEPVTVNGGNGFRLPTEAEWESACRAGTITTFSFGKGINSTMANFDGNYPYKSKKGILRNKTLPSGSFSPNAFCLYDMHGNVWEWCSDIYVEDYYLISPLKNPQCPEHPVNKVVRGGGYNYDGYFLRSAHRSNYLPTAQAWYLGFRVARSAE